MKQLSFLATPVESEQTPHETVSYVWKLYIDGASRKNPGIAGAGVYLIKDDLAVVKKGFFLGNKTNNQAEYLALLLGVFYAKKYVQHNDMLHIFSDSELLVNHMKAEYKIRNPDLKMLYDVAFVLLKNMRYSFCHILREYNVNADYLANEGIDKKVKVPHEFLMLIHTHGIQI